MARNQYKPEHVAVSPRTACEMLDIGKTKLFDLLKNNKLESTKVDGIRRITVASIKRLVGAE